MFTLIQLFCFILFYLLHILPTLGAFICSKNKRTMRVYNNAKTCKQSGQNCSKHQQCDKKDVGKICFENKSNLKQYLVGNLQK